MSIERLLKRGEERLAFVREMLGTNVQAVLHYLTEEEKAEVGLATLIPELDFTRAVVARAEISGEEKIRTFRRFLSGFVTIDLGGFGGDKTIRVLTEELEVVEGRVEFLIIFVHQVFGGKLSRHNVSYLIDCEIDAWEEALSSYLRHHMGGVTVIR